MFFQSCLSVSQSVCPQCHVTITNNTVYWTSLYSSHRTGYQPPSPTPPPPPSHKLHLVAKTEDLFKLVHLRTLLQPYWCWHLVAGYWSIQHVWWASGRNATDWKDFLLTCQYRHYFPKTVSLHILKKVQANLEIFLPNWQLKRALEAPERNDGFWTLRMLNCWFIADLNSSINLIKHGLHCKLTL